MVNVNLESGPPDLFVWIPNPEVSTSLYRLWVTYTLPEFKGVQSTHSWEHQRPWHVRLSSTCLFKDHIMDSGTCFRKTKSADASLDIPERFWSIYTFLEHLVHNQLMLATLTGDCKHKKRFFWQHIPSRKTKMRGKRNIDPKKKPWINTPGITA